MNPGLLTWSIPFLRRNVKRMDVYFTSEFDFFVREYKGDLKFVTDARGKVTGFRMGGMLAKRIE